MSGTSAISVCDYGVCPSVVFVVVGAVMLSPWLGVLVVFALDFVRGLNGIGFAAYK